MAIGEAERDRSRGLYPISVVAELTGLGPQTLRLYENKGLVSPTRTEGGTRRYSDSDLARLQRIAALTATGMNLAGVKQVLELEEENQRLREQLAALRRTLEVDSPGTGQS